MKSIKDFLSKKYNLPLISILFVAFILRFINLGYSDFQGDEIKALFLPDPGQNGFSFLMDQRKGPLQFIVTFLLKFFDPIYTNQFLIRLPFAIAGFLSVYFFYKLVEQLINSKVALFAAFFFATNGFFIAFSRIVQYQSLVILFSVLALYFIVLANKEDKFKISGVYLAFISWSLSVLAHYDGLFIFPVFCYYLVTWVKDESLKIKLKVKIKHILLSGLLFTLLLAVFYIPFVFSISESTYEYWEGRLSGSVSSKLSSSIYLFTVYQPIYVIHIYTLLAISGLFVLFARIKVKYLLHKNLKSKSIVRFLHTVDELFLASGYKKILWVVFVWFIVGIFVWEKIVYIPGTHIYTYLMPLFIFLGVGTSFVEKAAISVSDKIKFIPLLTVKDIVLSTVLVFVALQSYAIFVDNNVEYPWEQEKFYIWTFPKPTPIYHLSMFGFPYYRDWESIGDFVKEHDEIPAYSTNERESIARHHIKLTKDTNKAGFFVFIRNPQSFTNEILSQKALYWANKYPPVYTLSRAGKDLVTVYLMPVGTLDELKEQGY